MRSGDRLTNSYTIVFLSASQVCINVVRSFRDNKSAIKNTSDFDHTLLLARRDYSESSFAHSNERLTAFFQPL